MKRPQASNELKYLRLVTNQDWVNDDKRDVELSRYRTLMNEDPKWVLYHKRLAEKEYRDECAAWEKEHNTAKVQEDGPDEPCVLVVTRMLDEWDKHQVEA